MACISGNDKSSSRYFGDSLQLTNWILYSGETCHMTPQVSDLIPGPLEDTDKYIEVSGEHYVMPKRKGKIQITMSNDNRHPFIVKLHNLLLAPDLCDRLFSIITLMNSGHICLYNKGFFMVYFGNKKKNMVTLPHSAQRKYGFLVKRKEKSKSKKVSPKKKIALGLLYHR